ncbi:Na/Pi symporter [Piscibacillus salipiscarius]|uniref:Na/Pi symporter n=1 Tax=Piscibacillus salipiscarius TaxID=299480 RepID=UPI0006D08980|nr:Na/Pi symporter [Piscibacillus salipiscarius]
MSARRLFHDLYFKSKILLAGLIIFGLGVIFSALNGFESLANIIPTERIQYIVNSEHNTPLSLSIFGMLFTMIIQSSTVATGMLMSFSSEGTVPLIQIYYVLIGANIGTCFTVYLVSLKQPYHARITAYAHIWINVLGAIITFPILLRTQSYILQNGSQQFRSNKSYGPRLVITC